MTPPEVAAMISCFWSVPDGRFQDNRARLVPSQVPAGSSWIMSISIATRSTVRAARLAIIGGRLYLNLFDAARSHYYDAPLPICATVNRRGRFNSTQDPARRRLRLAGQRDLTRLFLRWSISRRVICCHHDEPDASPERNVHVRRRLRVRWRRGRPCGWLGWAGSAAAAAFRAAVRWARAFAAKMAPMRNIPGSPCGCLFAVLPR